jgi:hypothetical protein
MCAEDLNGAMEPAGGWSWRRLSIAVTAVSKLTSAPIKDGFFRALLFEPDRVCL